jgi:hypothetical protein
MLENRLGDPLALPEDIGLAATPSLQARTLKLRAILTGASSRSGPLLVRWEKRFCLACILTLMLPALLIAGVFSLLVARVLGVPLFARSPHAHRARLWPIR